MAGLSRVRVRSPRVSVIRPFRKRHIISGIVGAITIKPTFEHIGGAPEHVGDIFISQIAHGLLSLQVVSHNRWRGFLD